MSPLVLVLAALLTNPNADEPNADGPRACREQPEVKPPCYVVRGRLSLWNGTPTARIWIVGTKRILGVSDGHAVPGLERLPAAVRERLTWDYDVFGDYEFCPFTRERPGVMRLGCVQSAR